MLNIEKYKGEILSDLEDDISFGCTLCILREGSCEKICKDCRIKSYKWMYEEYKPKIKLNKFEYDLIVACTKSVNFESTDTFETWHILENMKAKGYFKDVVDTSMSLEEILRNAEVEDNATIN